MANFGIFDLGFVMEMNPSATPNEVQYISYPGAIGVEALNFGSRGGVIAVTAMLTAPDAGQLATKLSGLYTFKELMIVDILSDNMGRTYPNTIIQDVSESGRAMPLRGGGFGKIYQAVFRFLG